MITTTYKCDRCGAEQTTQEQFWQVCVAYSSNSNTPYKSYTMGMDVCRACIEDMGIFPASKNRTPQPPPPPTIEDLIREIVQAEMSEH